MRIGRTEFDPVIVGATVVIGLVAIALAFLLRDVLVQAPSTAFPLLLSVVVGGVMLVVWLGKRRQ